MSQKVAIVVLGQSLNPDGTPPATLCGRVKAAVSTWRETENSVIILTGGDPARTGRSEAKVMEEMIHLEGVPLDAMILEQESANTLQNAYYSVPILQQLGIRKMLLITSDFHMPRALYLFEAYLAHVDERIEIISVPALANFPGVCDVGINAMSLLQRLQMEKIIITSDVVQKHLRMHIPHHAIPPLPDQRLQRALDEVEHVILSAPLSSAAHD